MGYESIMKWPYKCGLGPKARWYSLFRVHAINGMGRHYRGFHNVQS